MATQVVLVHMDNIELLPLQKLVLRQWGVYYEVLEAHLYSLVSLPKHVTHEHAIESMQSIMQHVQSEPSQNMQTTRNTSDANVCAASPSFIM